MTTDARYHSVRCDLVEDDTAEEPIADEEAFALAPDPQEPEAATAHTLEREWNSVATVVGHSPVVVVESVPFRDVLDAADSGQAVHRRRDDPVVFVAVS